MSGPASSSKMMITACAMLFSGLETSLLAQSMEPRFYEVGTPVLTDIWVNRDTGNDGNSGDSRSEALASITEAWNRIPRTPLTATGYRILICGGVYTEGEAPVYWDGRHGTLEFPVILCAADGRGSVILPIVNVYDCQYLYLDDLVIEAGGGDALHFEKCRHILVRNSTVRGIGDIDNFEGPQEALKVNQCQYVYVENSDISGGWDNAIDFVAVQYGHIVANRIHRAREWCLYLKGGSACFRIEGNEIHDGRVGGFSAGQGSGLEFMVSPWLHYEAYDIKFFSNVIHDIEGAGMGVNGGTNILLAHNTLFRVGRTSHGIEVVFGLRACDGDVSQCSQYLAAGGWGTAVPGSEEPIPNRNVFIYNNLLYNPAGTSSAWSHFAIYGPRVPSASSNIPSPAEADRNLQIRGNLIWNGASDLPLGVEEGDRGCQPGNPTCYAAQLRNDNAINSVEPALENPGQGDYSTAPGSAAFTAPSFAIPDFPGGDLPLQPAVPAGNLVNSIPRDFDGNPRTTSSPVGAFVTAGSQVEAGRDSQNRSPRFNLAQNYPNPFNSETVISFDLPALSRVDLRVFNTQGMEIACMAHGVLNPGHHAIRLDAGRFSTGLYFYRLATGEGSRTKKMLLLR